MLVAICHRCVEFFSKVILWYFSNEMGLNVNLDKIKCRIIFNLVCADVKLQAFAAHTNTHKKWLNVNIDIGPKSCNLWFLNTSHSFFFCGIYWVQHKNVMTYIKLYTHTHAHVLYESVEVWLSAHVCSLTSSINACMHVCRWVYSCCLCAREGRRCRARAQLHTLRIGQRFQPVRAPSLSNELTLFLAFH